MKIAGWIIWGLGAIAFIYVVGRLLRAIPTGALSRPYGRTLLTFALCSAIALASTALIEFSKFHLLWMLPVALSFSLVFGVRRGAHTMSEMQDKNGPDAT
jgi:hypothetical protein